MTISDDSDDSYRALYLSSLSSQPSPIVTEEMKRGVCMSEVRITKKLFNALCQYHLYQHESEIDFIKAELEEKMLRNTMRIMYSQAKTGATKEVREKAMEVYQNLQKR